MFKVDCNKKITITEGDTGHLKLVIPNYTIKEDDTVKFSVSKEKAEGAKTGGYLFQKTVNGTNGMATIKIDPADTKGKGVGVYMYDIQLSNTSGDVYTVVEPNKFEIKGGITND